MKKLLITFPAVVLAAVALYFVVTTSPSVRYWVDDFCAGTILRNSGYFGAQVVWWKSWTGRFSYIAIWDFFLMLGPWVVKILPSLILISLVAAITPALSSLFLAAVFIVLVLANTPNIIQTLYWQTGSLNYTAPIIFFNLLLSFVVARNKKSSIYFAPVTAFIAGGFSEPFALAQAVILFFALFVLKGTRFKIVLAGLIGTAVSLIVMFLSPGNAAREASFTHPESLVFVIKSTILGTKWYLLRMLGIRSFIYSLLIIFSSVYLLGRKYVLGLKTAIQVMFLSTLGAIFSTAAVTGAGFYSMSIIPPERTLSIAVYMQLFCFLIFSFCLTSLLEKKISEKLKKLFFWGALTINIIFTALLVGTLVPHWSSVRSEVQVYATNFDKLEPTLKQSAGKDLTIKNIKPVGELDSFTDNKGWVASCLSGYYQISSIKISP